MCVRIGSLSLLLCMRTNGISAFPFLPSDIGNGTIGFGLEGTIGRASPMVSPVACGFPASYGFTSSLSDMFVIDGSRLRLMARASLSLSTLAGTRSIVFNGDGFAANASTLFSPLGVIGATNNQYGRRDLSADSESAHERELPVINSPLVAYIAGELAGRASGMTAAYPDSPLSFADVLVRHLELSPEGAL